MEIKGKVIQSLGVQNGTSKAGKAWSKAIIIIETEGQYPKKVALDNMKDADNFSKIPIGSTGVFHVEAESREFNGRWFTNINCWKWDLEQTTQPQSSTPNLDSLGVNGYSAQPQAAPAPQGEDDLPF